MWDLILGHLAKSAENLVNKRLHFSSSHHESCSELFVLMISRSSLKLGHLGSEYSHQAKSKENLVNTCVFEAIFEAIIMNLAQNACLDEF